MSRILKCKDLEEKHGSLWKWPGPQQRYKEGTCPRDKSSSRAYGWTAGGRVAGDTARKADGQAGQGLTRRGLPSSYGPWGAVASILSGAVALLGLHFGKVVPSTDFEERQERQVLSGDVGER